MLESDLEPPRPQPRRPIRQLLRAVAYVGFLAILLEGASWAVLAVLGRATELDPQVEAVLDTHASACDLDPHARARHPVDLREGVHPYLGFMPRVASRNVPDDVCMVWQPRFYAEDSPLFSTDPDDLIVGITGGSVAGQFARFGGSAELAAQLSKLPEHEGRRIRFVVIALGGFKQPQQLMGLNYALALGGRFDLLINMDGFNEVAMHELDNQRQGVSPIYPRSWFHRVNALESLPLIGHLQFVRDERCALAEARLETPFSGSRLGHLVWFWKDRELGLREQTLLDELRAYSPESRADLPTVGPASHASDAAGRLDELTAIWQRSSLQMHRICEANDTTYFHFLQPNQYLVDSKVLSDEELDSAFDPRRGYGKTVPAGYPCLQAASTGLLEAGVRFHDLTGVFGDVSETIYKDDCCHVNELGNRLMARAIAAAIASWSH